RDLTSTDSNRYRFESGSSLINIDLFTERCVYTERMRIISVVLILVASLFGESVAGLTWTPPKGWKTEEARPMRAATYAVPPAAGDAATAECVVYFFGAGQGGAVEANLDRWKRQMRAAAGK